MLSNAELNETRLVAARPRGQLRELFRQLVRTPSMIAGSILVLVVVAVMLSPLIFPIADPNAISVKARLASPSPEHWFGGDALGRDVFARIAYGAQTSLFVGFVSVIIAAVGGTILGIWGAYRGGWVDGLIMRCVDIIFGFPTILLALLVVTILGPATINVIFAIAIVYLPAFARISRAPALAVMRLPFIEVLRSMGAGAARVTGLHILPNVLGPLIVQFVVSLSYAILIEASLSYLGLGVQPPTPSWGSMISDGQTYLTMQPLLMMFPAAFLFITICGFNLIGDAMEAALDPRSRRR